MTAIARPTAAPVPELKLSPAASAWPQLLSDAAARQSPHAARFRQQLGLPTDCPLIMSGHQAQIWHPGILAKYLAGAALAEQTRSAFAWLVVDLDANTAEELRVPVRIARTGAHSAPALRARRWNFKGVGQVTDQVPTGRRTPAAPIQALALEPGEQWAAPNVGAGVHAIFDALAAHADAPSLAAQVAPATSDLLQPLIGQSPPMVMALAMTSTELFAHVIDLIRSDAARCQKAYNAAVAAHPGERIQPLDNDEVPLWLIDGAIGGARRRASVKDLQVRSPRELAPRALLMTGLIRWAGCDLFIHGTGGGGGGDHAGYDRITERWFREWLGPDTRLAPSVVATATLRLGIDHDGPDPAELRLRQWRAHRARHQPALLGEPDADLTKKNMVDEIRTLRRTGVDARPTYRRMHELLGRIRSEHAQQLAALDAEASDAAEHLRDAEVAADRTWPFPLYEHAQLAELHRRIQLELTSAASVH